MRGLVIRNTGSLYDVRTEEGNIVPCKVKGNFRLKDIKSTNPVAVGDYVQISPQKGTTSFITDIEERRNYIVRKASNLSKQSHIIAANLDEVFLVVTVKHPVTTTIFIDRFLATAEAYGIPVTLIFNKTDCYNEEEKQKMNNLISLYSRIGYVCHACSAIRGTGMDALKESLKDKTTLLSGHSGVGKSTIMNSLIPDTAARTRKLSIAHDSGMHTTSFSEMKNLPFGGHIIDTPGIKGFGSYDFSKWEIGHYFREIFQASVLCKYDNCTHNQEPDCAVRRAVENNEISVSRYTSYLNMLEDSEETKYRQAF